MVAPKCTTCVTISYTGETQAGGNYTGCTRETGSSSPVAPHTTVRASDRDYIAAREVGGAALSREGLVMSSSHSSSAHCQLPQRQSGAIRHC